MSSCSHYTKVIVRFKHFTVLRALLDELDVYHPLAIDISRMRQFHEELAVAVYLSILNLDLCSQIWGQTMGADSVLDLQTTFTKVLRISIATPAPVSDQTAMAATRGRGHGTSRGGDLGGT